MEKVMEQKNDNTQRQLSVDIETAKQWYKTNNEPLKQLALSLFTEEELTRIELPTSWEEFCEQNSKVDCEYYINTGSQIHTCIGSFRDSGGDRNLLATKEDAEAFLALIQLKRLRDQWWEALNWKPDYTDDSCKYTIVVDKNEISIGTAITYHIFLAFPTEEIAEDFLKCFEELIEKAKELI